MFLPVRNTSGIRQTMIKRSNVNSNQLIIIGGPSCAGKSFLIKRIQKGLYPGLCRQIELSNPSTCRYVNAINLKGIELSSRERLVVHYDFYTQQSKENEFNYLADLIDKFDRINVITIKVTRSILIKRNNSRIIKTSLEYIIILLSLRRKDRKRSALQNKLRRLWKKRNAYKNNQVELLYKKWFRYFNQFAEIKHYPLDNAESVTMNLYPYIPNKSCSGQPKADTRLKTFNHCSFS